MLKDKEFSGLVTGSAYIVDLEIVAALEPEIADFEGGDCWLFDRFQVRLNRQILPDEALPSWQQTELTMPGRKQGQRSQRLDIGQRVIAFYSYSAMARGYALEQLVEWNEKAVADIKAISVQEKREI